MGSRAGLTVRAVERNGFPTAERVKHKEAG
jgi:hypothetical protein